MTAYTEAFRGVALAHLSAPPKCVWVGVRLPLAVLEAYQAEAEACEIGTPELMAETLISKAPRKARDGR